MFGKMGMTRSNQCVSHFLRMDGNEEYDVHPTAAESRNYRVGQPLAPDILLPCVRSNLREQRLKLAERMQYPSAEISRTDMKEAKTRHNARTALWRLISRFSGGALTFVPWHLIRHRTLRLVGTPSAPQCSNGSV